MPVRLTNNLDCLFLGVANTELVYGILHVYGIVRFGMSWILQSQTMLLLRLVRLFNRLQQSWPWAAWSASRVLSSPLMVCYLHCSGSCRLCLQWQCCVIPENFKEIGASKMPYTYVLNFDRSTLYKHVTYCCGSVNRDPCITLTCNFKIARLQFTNFWPKPDPNPNPLLSLAK